MPFVMALGTIEFLIKRKILKHLNISSFFSENLRKNGPVKNEYEFLGPKERNMVIY
jgi:hypothetical protein